MEDTDEQTDDLPLWTARRLLYDLLDYLEDTPIPTAEWGRQFWLLDGSPRTLIDHPDTGKMWVAPERVNEYPDAEVVETINEDGPVSRISLMVADHPTKKDKLQTAANFTPEGNPNDSVHAMGMLALRYVEQGQYSYPDRFLIFTGSSRDNRFGWDGFQASSERLVDAVKAAPSLASDEAEEFWQVVDLKKGEVVKRGQAL